MNRTLSITEKVRTPFGSLYAHVSHDGAGKLIEVSFSSPGKFSDTSIDSALLALAAAVCAMIEQIGGTE